MAAAAPFAGELERGYKRQDFLSGDRSSVQFFILTSVFLSFCRSLLAGEVEMLRLFRRSRRKISFVYCSLSRLQFHLSSRKEATRNDVITTSSFPLCFLLLNRGEYGGAHSLKWNTPVISSFSGNFSAAKSIFSPLIRGCPSPPPLPPARGRGGGRSLGLSDSRITAIDSLITRPFNAGD